MCTSNTMHMKSELITGNIAVMKTDSSLFACSPLITFFSCHSRLTHFNPVSVANEWHFSFCLVSPRAPSDWEHDKQFNNPPQIGGPWKGSKIETWRKEIKINTSTSAEKAIQSIDEIYLFEHGNVNAFFVLTPPLSLYSLIQCIFSIPSFLYLPKVVSSR